MYTNLIFSNKLPPERYEIVESFIDFRQCLGIQRTNRGEVILGNAES